MNEFKFNKERWWKARDDGRVIVDARDERLFKVSGDRTSLAEDLAHAKLAAQAPRMRDLLIYLWNSNPLPVEINDQVVLLLQELGVRDTRIAELGHPGGPQDVTIVPDAPPSRLEEAPGQMHGILLEMHEQKPEISRLDFFVGCLIARGWGDLHDPYTVRQSLPKVIDQAQQITMLLDERVGVL